MNLRYIAGFGALLVAIALIHDIGPSFIAWANRSLDAAGHAAAPASTCTCPPAPTPPVGAP